MSASDMRGEIPGDHPDIASLIQRYACWHQKCPELGKTGSGQPQPR